MNENVNVCITPKGDKPVLHFSQFDNERVFTVTVLADDGESAVDLTDLDIEFRLRKTDSHVVTIAPISVVSNVITFLTTEQLCACCGQNIASVVIMNNDSVISTLDILVDIQRDILSGGLTSESDIRNLTTQIETIIPEVLADDYYTKTEVDDLIDDIPTFDPSNYYDKSSVDGLLDDKANAADVYTKTEVDYTFASKIYANNAASTALMDAKEYADTKFTPSTDLSTVATSGSYNDLLNKPYIPNTYSTTEEQIVGTWIDGRPIYRKVAVYENNLPSASGWQTLLSVPGVEAVINSRTIVDENASGRTIGTRDMYLIEAAPTYNNIQIYNASPYGVYVKWVIVEYIKTA